MKKKITKAKKKTVVKKKKSAVKVKARPKKKAVPAKKVKKIVKKAAKSKARLAAKSNKPIGVVTHFYNEISVAIIRFKEKVPQGTKLRFRGATTDFEHVAKSMQYEHAPVAVAPKGKQIGIKVPKRVREGDKVHRA
jgi:translation elongation factor EF-1beta